MNKCLLVSNQRSTAFGPLQVVAYSSGSSSSKSSIVVVVVVVVV